MKIDVGASFCKVQGTKEELFWLRDLLTFDVPGAKFTPIFRQGRWDGCKRFFNMASNVFPIGLLDFIERKKGTRRIEIVDHRDFPVIDLEPPVLQTIELREYQKEAIRNCLVSKNCLIEAATNAGKTAIFSGIIKKLHPLPILVLTHRDELLRQTVAFIERYTGLECGFITSKDTNIKPVTVAMVTTLINRLGVEQDVTDFFNSVQCVIIDECHHLKARQFQTLVSASKASYRMGFSGTIPDEDTYDGVLVRQYVGSVAYKIKNDELIDMGVSAKPKIIFYEMDVHDILHNVFNLAKEELKAEDPNYTPSMLIKRVYRLVVQKGIVENSSRNEKVVEILNNNQNKSTLIIVDFLEHGKIVQDLITRNGIENKFISGESPHRKSALDDFKSGKLKVLVSSNILDEGVDVSRIEVLVMLAGKKSRRQVLQRIGRSLRRKEGVNEVVVYDFLDLGNKYLQAHSKNRYAIYKSEGFDIQFIS